MIKIKGHFSRYLLFISCLIVLSSCPPGGVHINDDIDAFLEKGTKIAERNKKQQETFVSVDYTSKVVGLLRYVPEGEYTGRVSGDVSIEPFCMAETEVTQKAWQEVMGGNPSLIVDESKTSGDLPVNGISLVDAMKFCHQLSIKEGLEPVYFYQNQRGETITHLDSWPVDPTQIQVNPDRSGYRLPTVKEYRWASMGANRGSGSLNYDVQKEWEEKKFSGDTPGKSHSISDYAWYQGNSGGGLQPVKKKKPNEIELYDLSGNASEWAGPSFQVMGGEFSDPEPQLALGSDFQQGTSFSGSLVIEATEASATGPGIWEWKASGNADLPQSPNVKVTLTAPNELDLEATNVNLSDVEMNVEMMRLMEEALKDKALSGEVAKAEWVGGKWILKSGGKVTNVNVWPGTLTGPVTGTLTGTLTGPVTLAGTTGPWTWTREPTGALIGTWTGPGTLTGTLTETGTVIWTGTETGTLTWTWTGPVPMTWTGPGILTWTETETGPWRWTGTGTGTGTLTGPWTGPVPVPIDTITAQNDIEIKINKSSIKKARLTQVSLQVGNKTFIAQLPGLSLKKNGSGRLEGSGKIKVTAPGFRVVRKPSR